MIARLSPFRTRVVIEGTFWAEDIGVEDLPSRLRFYEWLGARSGGKYAHHYQPTIDALRAVTAEIKQGAAAQ